MGKQPRIKIEESNSVKTKNRIALLFVIGHFLLVITCYNALPDIIPSHFNFSGQADKSASKIIIWFLPFLSFGVFQLLKITNKHPHIHNYRVKITEENAKAEYSKSMEIGAYINMMTEAILFIVTLAVVITAFNSSSKIGTLLIPFTVLYLILIIRKSFPTQSYNK